MLMGLRHSVGQSSLPGWGASSTFHFQEMQKTGLDASRYLSISLSLGDPVKTPTHSMSPFASSTTAANSASLLLAHFPVNTNFSCPHLPSPGISYQPAPNPCLSASISVLFASGLAGLTTSFLASPCPDLTWSS